MKANKVIGLPKEIYPKEKRVALIPSTVGQLIEKGFEIIVESGAGLNAGFRDYQYQDKGAHILASRQELFCKASIIVQVRSFGANGKAFEQDFDLFNKDQIVIGLADPLVQPQPLQEVAASGVISFALELVPRITRAQSMDVLSSMATVAGYKAVLLAASVANRMFPMMMTAAGTISPAKVFVIGAGVAGLQAIASAKRLGAVVTAYDVRSAVKEQIESLGGKFLEIKLDAGEAEDKGGYAKEMSKEFLAKQRQMMSEAIAVSDAVITTAAIPGKQAPIIVTKEMVEKMSEGSVVVDLAAESGGNCQLTKVGQTYTHKGVIIVGDLNVASTIPYHASQMYAKNMVSFLLNLLNKEGQIDLDKDDEIIKATMVTRAGEICNERVKQAL